MRRFGIMVVLVALWSPATAQERTGYVGFGVSYATYTGVVPNYPLPSLQIGGAISDTLELRGTLESILLVSNLGLDVLYPISLTGSDVQLYTGGGANVRFFAYYPNGFDLRGVFGVEYGLASEAPPLSVFAEVRLYVRGLVAGFPTVEGRAGINVPF